ncbi:OmpA family protein [Duganella sp. FT80W]|uniref:OmpA family protein n=1 Tax=Duganella guangzhouensis TaxID=2666084 RepID=A0A6I2L7L9_9BURK|nr:OmpA family protein [Duganella guangzhouensis]MRW93652.1 OmpA family protein [Duganella guangzhouensis]
MKATLPTLAVLLVCLSGATEAAEKRLYLYGTPTGCLVQLTAPLEDKQSLRWEGSCEREFAQGPGALAVVDGNGQVVKSTEGTMLRGVMGELANTDTAAAPAADTQAGTTTANTTLVVYFDHNSSTLSDAAQSQLQAYYAALPATDKLRIKISGHSDPSGSLRAREKVAQARAQSVRAHLTMLGLTSEQLIVASKDDPSTTTTSQLAASERRRVNLEAWSEP